MQRIEAPAPLAPQALFVLKLLRFARTTGIQIHYFRGDISPDWATDWRHLRSLTRQGFLEVTYRDSVSTVWQITPAGEKRLKEELTCSSQT